MTAIATTITPVTSIVLADSNEQGSLWDTLWTTATVKCTDGSIYKGYLDRFGNRTGFGRFVAPVCLYGAVTGDARTLVHWTEYSGGWKDDEAHGHGVLSRHRGDGKVVVIFEGEWYNGNPDDYSADSFKE